MTKDTRKLQKPTTASKVNFITQTLAHGWRRRVYLRTSGASAGRKDVVLISPDDVILRSNVEIERYCKEHKMNLDMRVYNVSQATVEGVFKKEIAEMAKKGMITVVNKSTPKVVKKSSGAITKENEKAKRESIATKTQAKKLSFPVKTKKGRPSKKSVLSERRRNQSGDSGSSSVAPKRKLSEESSKDVKKIKLDAFPVGLTGRQTRNSLAASLPPLSSTKAAEMVTPDSLPSSWKMEERGGRKTILVEDGRVSLGSVRQLKIYSAKHGVSLDLEKFESFFERYEEDTQNDEEAEEVMVEETADDEEEQENVVAEQEIPEVSTENAEEQEAEIDEDLEEQSEEEIKEGSGEQEEKSIADENNGVEVTEELERQAEVSGIEQDEEKAEETEDDDSDDEDFETRVFTTEPQPEDYELPLDDVEISIQADESAEGEKIEEEKEEDDDAETLSCPSGVASPLAEPVEDELEIEDIPIAEVEESREPEVQTDLENTAIEAGEIKVVNSKDLDKIDLANFKFFVLPDNDEELPDEVLKEWNPTGDCEVEVNKEGEHIPREETTEPENAEAVGELKELQQAEKIVYAEDAILQITKAIEAAETMPPKEEEQTENPIKENPITPDTKEDQTPESPFHLIYESLGKDPWCLLAASLIQPHVAAQVGHVLTLNFLKRCPDAQSVLQLPDIFSLPECEMDPKFAWVLGKLQKLGNRLVQGEKAEEMEDLVGSYGLAILAIFCEGRLDVETKEYDLKAYLEWRNNQQR